MRVRPRPAGEEPRPDRTVPARRGVTIAIRFFRDVESRQKSAGAPFARAPRGKRASYHSRRRGGAMTRRETRLETREADREAREAASALDPAPATPAAPNLPARLSTKPKPLDASERFDGPGVPYEHKFSTVSRGPVGVATLDGTIAADLVCWEYFYGKPCASEAERASSEDAARLEPWKSYAEGWSNGICRPPRPATTVPSSSCDLCHAIGTADDVCRGRVREALGQIRPKKGVRARLGSGAADAAGRKNVVCRYGPRCDRAHPSDAEVRGKIEDWYVTSGRFETRKRENADGASERPARPARDRPTWSVFGSGASNFRLRDAGARAARTSASERSRARDRTRDRDETTDEHRTKGDDRTRDRDASKDPKEAARRDLASARTRRRLVEKAETSRYVSAFTNERFFAEILDGDPAFARVLSHKSAHKEITEAYGARYKIAQTLRGLGWDDEAAGKGGAGVTIFDACSGRGVVGVLLGYFFPNARVVMLDANGSMDLSHVAAKGNVRFAHCDLYGDSAVRAIRETIEDEDREDDARDDVAEDEKKKTPHPRRFRVLLGMHLCGALSPRLIDLAFGLDEVDGLVLCPCCVKGGLGGACRRAAKERNVSPYVVLCETFRRLCEEETRTRRKTKGFCGDADAREENARVVACADEDVLSPVNGFICVAKSGPGMPTETR